MAKTVTLGLMSGTSLDGVDAVAVDFSGVGPRLIGHHHIEFPKPLKEKLLALCQPADVQATLVMLTARTITDAIKKFAGRTEEIYLCGGGALNGALAQCIRECAGEAIYVRSTSALGVDPMHVEAMAFAWLAWAFLQKKPGNLPEVTNASGARLLGALYPH